MARLFVSYRQYEVFAAPGSSSPGIHTIGDDLLHVGGPSRLTGFCGIHTGWIEARALVLPGPPAQPTAGWDAVSEATLWCPGGRLSVIGLMGGTADPLTDVEVPRGLIRVRVHARNRLDETERTDGDPPEQHELHIWPVSEEKPWRTLAAGPGGRTLRHEGVLGRHAVALGLVWDHLLDSPWPHPWTATLAAQAEKARARSCSRPSHSRL